MTTNSLNDILTRMEQLNDDEIAKLNEDEITELLKQINPYSQSFENNGEFVNLCCTNMRENFMKKILTTSLIGLLFRACDEWEVPDNIPVVPVDAYLENPNILNEYEVPNDKFIKMENEFNKLWMDKRVIVREFLESIFHFNPDFHVRSSYLPNTKDPERATLFTDTAKLSVRTYLKRNKKFAEKHGKQFIDLYRTQPNDDVYSQPLYTNIRKVKFDETMKDDNVENTTYNIIPSEDLFNKFKRYYDSNYEKLMKITCTIYNDKPDISLLINPLKIHTSKQSAELFKKKYAKDMIADVMTLETGKWAIIGPYSENKARMQFYDDNKGVLEEMLKQNEKDSKIASEIMKYNVIKKKTENIKRYGPDDKGLSQYKSSFGKHSTYNYDDEKKLLDVNEDNDDNELIEVKVFNMKKGGKETTVNKIYSKAMPPLHMLNESERQELIETDEKKTE